MLSSFLLKFVATAAEVIVLLAHASPIIEERQSVGLPAGWSSIGCFSDISSSRTLKVASFTSVENMTIESCLAFCTPAEYIFAGVEFARECYCDNVIEPTGVPISSSTCNMPCTGNTNEICGGAGGINIFENANATGISPPPPPPPSTGTIVQAVGPFEYKGCYQDGVNGAPRSLQTQLSVAGGVTAESCTAACKASGFQIAGLEFGQECWCDSYMTLAVLTPDTDCNMVCVANNVELCGAGNRLAVYVDSSQSPLSLTQCLDLVFSFDIVAMFVPTSPGAPVPAPMPIGSMELPAEIEEISTVVLTQRFSNDPHVYSISSKEGLSSIQQPSFDGFLPAVAVQPQPGGIQLFEEPGTSVQPPIPFVGYCPLPNPLTASTYIGPPVLGVEGILAGGGVRSDAWAFCPPVIFLLNASGAFPSGSQPAGSSSFLAANCSLVLLAMTQGIV